MTRLVVLSLLLFFLAAITRPQHARCPSGWFLDRGVRASGVYECAPLPPAHYVRTKRGGWIDASKGEGGAVESAIYCTGGQVAITRDGTTVGCEARH